MAVIDWSAVKNALATWVQTVLPGVPAWWAGQDLERPPYPYVVLDIVSGPRTLHHDAARLYSTQGGAKVRTLYVGDRELGISVEPIVSFEGVAWDHAADAHALAEELRSSLERRDTLDILKIGGLGVVEVGGASNRRTVVEAGTLSRAGFDLTIGLTAVFDPGAMGDADYIERIHAQGNVDGHESGKLYGAAGGPTEVGDMTAWGEMHVTATAPTALTAAGWTKVGGTTAPGALQDFDHPASGRLRYVGTVAKTFRAHVSASFIASADGSLARLALAKNGTPIAESELRELLDGDGSGDAPQGVTLPWLLQLQPNDYLELVARAASGSFNLTATQLVAVVTD